jgi:hypothetical protein
MERRAYCGSPTPAHFGTRGGFGDVPPEPQAATDPPPPDCNIVADSQCNEKCLADYVEAATICGKKEDAALRKTCDNNAYAVYKSCRDNCTQKENDCKERCKKQCDKIHDRCHADCTTSRCHAECNDEYSNAFWSVSRAARSTDV